MKYFFLSFIFFLIGCLSLPNFTHQKKRSLNIKYQDTKEDHKRDKQEHKQLINTSKIASRTTDREIKRYLIKISIMNYSGNCPCPYFTDRAGRRCGGRSAWSRVGGASPLCYENDISDQMVQLARRKLKN